jgi:hypothetical protein
MIYITALVVAQRWICKTVTAFVELTQNAYGGSTIRKLAEAYK